MKTPKQILSQRQRTLAKSLKDFNFECIGTAQTDDETVICASLRHFGQLIDSIEDERDRMLEQAHQQIILSLEDFRKKQIGGVKENKKKFDKKTEKFCQSQERFLNMSTKKPENTIQEADASLGMHEREYINESLSYVLRIQEVQERIKFEFVEILLAFVQGWMVFYHSAHDAGRDQADYLKDLTHKVQKTRANFDEAREKVNELKSKYMEKKTKPEEKFTKRGYLFLMEKKPFKATWTKYYCTYKKQQKQFTMLQFNQISGRAESAIETVTLQSCQRRASEFEKRFCFDLSFKEKPQVIYTFQALSEEDRKAWINAMDGTEPTYLQPGKAKGAEEYQLDEVGFTFVRKCIEVLESRGLEDEGIYRKSGVGTKIAKLLSIGMDRKKTEIVFTDEQYRDLMESNTIASALKTYLRNLSEPLMTYRYHNGFIMAAKQESLRQRVHDVHTLVHRLPKANYEMLEMVIRHLTEVARKYERNKMSVFNLGVVFGPTLLRPQEETVAAILDIKFNNIVINILIENYDLIFKTAPGSGAPIDASPPLRTSRQHTSNSNSGHNGPTKPASSSNSTSRNSLMYSPQQQVFRFVAKSNYTDQPMSSSLQSIPNGSIYMNTSPGSTSTGGGISSSNGSKNNGHAINSLPKNVPSGMSNSITVTGGGNNSVGGGNGSIVGSSGGIGSVKNHHQLSPHMALSESDISIRREPTYVSVSSNLLTGSNGPISNSGGSSGGVGANLNNSSHHQNQSSLRSEYLLASMPTATAQPINHRDRLSSSQSHVSSVVGNVNTTSPQSNAHRNLDDTRSLIYGQTTHSRHMTYATAKHYPGREHSTSSSNESVCDSISSNRDKQIGRLSSGLTSTTITSRGGSTDYVPSPSSINSSISTLLVDDTPTHSSEYPAPKKIHRTKDINQIKKDLQAGTARVRTLYACLGENEGELSFEPNQIITNVRYSHEPGWLQGTLNGKTGLIPENYVEHLKPYHSLT
ncbi:rho GTPase-activating protein Graf [Condylostylus longicornis]|uniref:rho GTPase-activating protein Graf n=1 Tax=Condylostylus longicornis TaxID=2530218 RepID=UPI00244E4A69|nr:rho GTPase-activating protein Graf [Condylostylus longicornis]